jgi:hypothetical protein
VVLAADPLPRRRRSSRRRRSPAPPSRSRYGKVTPLQTLASGQTEAVAVSANLSHLAPGTTYHYRLLVAGLRASAQPPIMAYGKGRTFTTIAAGRLLLSRRTLRFTGRTIFVPLACRSRLACAGRFSISTRARVGARHHLTTMLCASTLTRIAAGRTKNVPARIHGNCLALLRHAHGHRIAAKLIGRPRTGQHGTIKNITLRLSPSQRHEPGWPGL